MNTIKNFELFCNEQDGQHQFVVLSNKFMVLGIGPAEAEAISAAQQRDPYVPNTLAEKGDNEFMLIPVSAEEAHRLSDSGLSQNDVKSILSWPRHHVIEQ